MNSLQRFIKENRKIFKLAVVISIFLIVVGVVIYIKFFYDTSNGFNCLYRRIFGVYCMDCGSTRQLYYFLNGNFKEGFLYNVGCVVIYPTYMYLYYLIFMWEVFDRKISTRQAYALVVLAVILIIYMILRNIPIEAFNVLRPAE